MFVLRVIMIWTIRHHICIIWERLTMILNLLFIVSIYMRCLIARIMIFSWCLSFRIQVLNLISILNILLFIKLLCVQFKFTLIILTSSSFLILIIRFFVGRLFIVIIEPMFIIKARIISIILILICIILKLLIAVLILQFIFYIWLIYLLKLPKIFSWFLSSKVQELNLIILITRQFFIIFWYLLNLLTWFIHSTQQFNFLISQFFDCFILIIRIHFKLLMISN